MSYHLTGILNAALFLLTLAGLQSQLRLVWERKQAYSKGELSEGPTAVLSLNQFTSSYLAFISFFLYGIALERFNHYLVWPRLAAALMTLIVLWEILISRRDWASMASFALCVAALVILPVEMLGPLPGAEASRKG